MVPFQSCKSRMCNFFQPTISLSLYVFSTSVHNSLDIISSLKLFMCPQLRIKVECSTTRHFFFLSTLLTQQKIPKSNVVTFADLSYSLVAIISENSNNNHSNGNTTTHQTTVTDSECYIPGPILGSEPPRKGTFPS